MPSVALRLRHVKSKIKWAKKHIVELDQAWGAFKKSNPYVLGTKLHPKTKRRIYYIASAMRVPILFSLLAGGAIQALVSALDYLAYELVRSHTGVDLPPNFRDIQFPVADTAKKYRARRGRVIRGASRAAIKAINALKPYKRGNRLLWTLARLNNIDKHRLLMTAAAGVIQLKYVPPTPPGWRGAPMAQLAIWLDFKHPVFPVEQGSELFIDLPNAEINDQIQFRVQIAIREIEAGIVKPQPLIDTLHQFTTLVEGIVGALTPCLRSTPDTRGHGRRRGTPAGVRQSSSGTPSKSSNTP